MLIDSYSNIRDSAFLPDRALDSYREITGKMRLYMN